MNGSLWQSPFNTQLFRQSATSIFSSSNPVKATKASIPSTFSALSKEISCRLRAARGYCLKSRPGLAPFQILLDYFTLTPICSSSLADKEVFPPPVIEHSNFMAGDLGASSLAKSPHCPSHPKQTTYPSDEYDQTRLE